MTAIPLIVLNEPPQWVLLDLQGDISLRRTLGGSSQSADRPQPNAITTYSGLELGVFKQNNGKLQLRIGNHMLSCQLVTLKKPFLVLQRARHTNKQQQRTAHTDSDMQTDDGSDDEQHNTTAEGEEESVGLYCVAVVRHKVLVNTRPAPIIVGQTGPMPVLT